MHFNKIGYKNTYYFPPLAYIIKGGKGFQGAWEVLEKTWVGNLGRERLIQMLQEPTQSEFLELFLFFLEAQLLGASGIWWGVIFCRFHNVAYSPKWPEIGWKYERL